MRIAIDARLNAYRRGGIPQYTRQLLTTLANFARDDQFISLQHRAMLRPLAVAPNVSRRTVFTPPHHRFEPWTLPLELLLVRPDVVHFPDFIAPPRRPCPAVVTIHDLAFMHYPEILDDAARAFYGQIKASTDRADAVIAVSEATRQDVSQFLDLPIEQVQVIYEAAAPVFRPIELRAGEARVLNGVPVAAGSFMLFVSTLEPRKNLPTLLAALRICLDRQPGRPYRLVIVGGRGWRDDAIFAAVRDYRLADYVLFAGSIGQYDLRWLYNACQFYINPSLYEGFGLPLLEAMACGAACLAAATSSLPEIAGDAAIYVPPLDAGLWADAIEELWDNPERQEELGRIGLARAQRFSWARAARETMAVYQRVIQASGRGAVAPPYVPVADTQPPVTTAADAPFDPNPLNADGTRPCLRCATALIPGELQQGTAIRLAGQVTDQAVLVPRAWVCPHCGYVEMVTEHVEADEEQGSQPTPPAPAPLYDEDSIATEFAATATHADVHATGAQVAAASDGPAMDEHAPEAGAPEQRTLPEPVDITEAAPLEPEHAQANADETSGRAAQSLEAGAAAPQDPAPESPGVEAVESLAVSAPDGQAPGEPVEASTADLEDAQHRNAVAEPVEDGDSAADSAPEARTMADLAKGDRPVDLVQHEETGADLLPETNAGTPAHINNGAAAEPATERGRQRAPRTDQPAKRSNAASRSGDTPVAQNAPRAEAQASPKPQRSRSRRKRS